MNINKKQPIHWCTGNPGKEVPHELKRKAIGPAGQVVDMPLATGKTVKSMVGNNYGQLKMLEKPARGWLWYDDFEDEKARDAIIAARREAKDASNADYAKLFESKLDKLTAALEASAKNNERPTISDEQLQRVMLEEPAKAKKSK